MKIFPTASIKELDAYTIENEPIASIELMERAAQALKAAFLKHYDAEVPIVVFAGPGNNGGDALALARLLAEDGFSLTVYLFNPSNRLSPDCEQNKERLLAEAGGVEFYEITSQFSPPTLTDKHVVIDGLFGSGLNKPLSGGFAAVVKFINASPARVVAIDVPSGLMGEENSYNIRSHIVRAHLTLSLQLPKLAFLFAENQEFVGQWTLLDIGLSQAGIDALRTDYTLSDEEWVKSLVKPRPKFAHKGNFGHALLVAGSEGMAGASVLAARATLRSGVGLLTLHVPRCNHQIVQTTVPEAMAELDDSMHCLSQVPDADSYSAVGIGPGLGKAAETEAALLRMIETAHTPLVIDADALNILSEHKNHLFRLPKGSILTPHPIELERLTGRCSDSYQRLVKARTLAEKAGVHVVLKGAYTCIITPQGTCHFNPTGNPGMATGGSGDVLTGVILALSAQGYSAHDAAILGVYVHGLAGDMAAASNGETGMTAGDIADYLPKAWLKVAGK
ncbi:MAG: NAD(P)H-hydrate dehydratase [Mediterranea sp.]|jgi:NAD(P)H-hydrate epimerase|nr:NAD(P)H-hydrate dehydratase [Mediterranea sp.]